MAECEGYLKKMSVLVYWTDSARNAVPKLWRYIWRYFFLQDHTLCYTHTKKEHNLNSPCKIYVDLLRIQEIAFLGKKIEILGVDGARHTLKGKKEEMQMWERHLSRYKSPARSTLTTSPSRPLPVPSRSLPQLNLPPRTLHRSNSSPHNTTQDSHKDNSPPNAGLTHNLQRENSPPNAEFTHDLLVKENSPPPPLITQDLHKKEPPQPSPKSQVGSIGSIGSIGSLASNKSEWEDFDSGISGDATINMSWDEWDAIFSRSEEGLPL